MNVALNPLIALLFEESQERCPIAEFYQYFQRLFVSDSPADQLFLLNFLTPVICEAQEQKQLQQSSAVPGKRRKAESFSQSHSNPPGYGSNRFSSTNTSSHSTIKACDDWTVVRNVFQFLSQAVRTHNHMCEMVGVWAMKALFFFDANFLQTQRVKLDFDKREAMNSKDFFRLHSNVPLVKLLLDTLEECLLTSVNLYTTSAHQPPKRSALPLASSPNINMFVLVTQEILEFERQKNSTHATWILNSLIERLPSYFCPVVYYQLICICIHPKSPPSVAMLIDYLGESNSHIIPTDPFFVHPTSIRPLSAICSNTLLTSPHDIEMITHTLIDRYVSSLGLMQPADPFGCYFLQAILSLCYFCPLIFKICIRYIRENGILHKLESLYSWETRYTFSKILVDLPRPTIGDPLNVIEVYPFTTNIATAWLNIILQKDIYQVLVELMLLYIDLRKCSAKIENKAYIHQLSVIIELVYSKVVMCDTFLFRQTPESTSSNMPALPYIIQSLVDDISGSPPQALQYNHTPSYTIPLLEFLSYSLEPTERARILVLFAQHKELNDNILLHFDKLLDSFSSRDKSILSVFFGLFTESMNTTPDTFLCGIKFLQAYICELASYIRRNFMEVMQPKLLLWAEYTFHTTNSDIPPTLLQFICTYLRQYPEKLDVDFLTKLCDIIFNYYTFLISQDYININEKSSFAILEICRDILTGITKLDVISKQLSNNILDYWFSETVDTLFRLPGGIPVRGTNISTIHPTIDDVTARNPSPCANQVIRAGVRLKTRHESSGYDRSGVLPTPKSNAHPLQSALVSKSVGNNLTILARNRELVDLSIGLCGASQDFSTIFCESLFKRTVVPLHTSKLSSDADIYFWNRDKETHLLKMISSYPHLFPLLIGMAELDSNRMNRFWEPLMSLFSYVIDVWPRDLSCAVTQRPIYGIACHLLHLLDKLSWLPKPLFALSSILGNLPTTDAAKVLMHAKAQCRLKREAAPGMISDDVVAQSDTMREITPILCRNIHAFHDSPLLLILLRQEERKTGITPTGNE